MALSNLPPDFRVIPVIDIRGGIVVRAIGGRRDQYQPLTSRLTNSTDPLQVACDLRDFIETDELYLADLDAIAGQPPALTLFETLARNGFRLWVDAGVRLPADVGPLFDASVTNAILGLETLKSPDTLMAITARWEPARTIFSLDLAQGRPLGWPATWPTQPEKVVDVLATLNIRRVILLDLARVGTGTGTGTEHLCTWAKNTYPDLEIIVGGGVHGPEDLPRLKAAGASAALIASALHDGRFGLP